MDEFYRISRLPPYGLGVVRDLLFEARRKGDDIIDLGMGNPDMSTPKYIVSKLIEAARNPKNHRYSVTRGIYKLRLAIASWYKRKYDVDVDPETEIVVTMGAKEGLGHLVLATISQGEVVFVPDPGYPIHMYSVVIAGGDLRTIPLAPKEEFFRRLSIATKTTWPQPKMLIISFPNNPTTEVVEIGFFEKIYEFAKEHNIMVIHDLAYADLVFDGYNAPSFLQIKGAKDVGVEFFSMSKSYSMPGWRVGFVVGNKKMISALGRIKSYFDYGVFQPIQIASIIALNEGDNDVIDIVDKYKRRRDVLCEGLTRYGWTIEKPKATMFVWAKIPEQFSSMGSLEFSKLLLHEAKVATSPGIGFGEYGEGYIRFALVENEHRIRQAVKGIRGLLYSSSKK
ncbi:MAG TPA: aminotransferase class I/II-fold pyridoxal phosphate-dependent enzyme [Syntrophorhabdaceae bacterium]|nr:aminotransferase class I/II-fold pyridoxal phosphate-dependent enzyme [Syntrophorhabdaceae bacterium]HNZ58052.1 aminotransferase class I/II-fold pyridoxal phosphate-dependent enzyme [Syntrophorhabdaceae bacterium]HOB69033.1 aminotransferase class I/II-fold pyridoxal phosphate-dependent enzyme [Syntrophorhabdaceae bacterium]HOG39557.1 aminotransferase class I/II-fold pyridoxal phosphate-dependent enzyme [Syntrophorhabdaceae bacterium]HPH41350.1 aminotransferase class I/II-fold pyridoxal phosp